MPLDLGYSHTTKAVILDLDGTLYSQKCLRLKVAIDLLRYYTSRPHKLHEVRLISEYRKVRETSPVPSNGKSFEEFHLELVASKFQVSVRDVQRIVEIWIYQRPLKFLKSCMYVGAKDFLEWLKRQNVKTAILSDYPADQKLLAMDLDVDTVVSAHDKDVCCLKPDPTGLRKTIAQLGCKPEECVYIGDREDRDGICARSLEVPFVLVEKTKFDSVSNCFYPNLLKQWKT